ncbi:MAG: hypothetical protein M1840_000794 [Geoglossum simile]|nr:MAG: hypothetical protein M1840_000794 [Geoglossum simile]
MADQVLPADWKLDYDTAAKQWCYIHKITSRKQYTFPKDGDELNLGSEPAPLHPVKDGPRHAEDQSLEVNMASLGVSSRETVARRDSNATEFRQPTPKSGMLQPSEDGAWRFVEPGDVDTTPQVNESGQEPVMGPRRSDTAVSALDASTDQGLELAGPEGGESAQGQDQASPTSTSEFATNQQGLVEMSGNWPGQQLTTTPASTTSPVSAQQQYIPPQTPLSSVSSQSTSNYTTTPPQQQGYGNGQSSSPTPPPSVYSVSSVGHDPHTPQRQDSMVSTLGYQNPPQGHSPPAQGYGGIPQQQPPPQQQYNAIPQNFYAAQQPYQQYQQYPPQTPSTMSAPSRPAGTPYYPPQSAPVSAYSNGPSVHKSRFDSLFPKSKSALPPPASRRPYMMRPPIQYQQAMRPTEVQTMGNITINHYSVMPSGAPAQQRPPQQPLLQQWHPSPPQYQQAPPQQQQQQYPVYQPPPTPQQVPPMGQPGTAPSPPQYEQPQPIYPPPTTIPSPQQQVYQPSSGFQTPQQFGAPQ